MKRLLLFLIMLFFSGLSYADNAAMKESLVKIIRQLQAIKPLLAQAQQAQEKNPRIKVHFDSWTDGNGVTHNGLRQDIEAIQNAIIHIAAGETVEPRVYKPIQNDFIGEKDV